MNQDDKTLLDFGQFMKDILPDERLAHHAEALMWDVLDNIRQGVQRINTFVCVLHVDDKGDPVQVMCVDSPPYTHETGVAVFTEFGKALAESGAIGTMLATFVVYEAWAKESKDGEVIPEGQKKEVIVISGLTVDARVINIIIDMGRKDNGDIIVVDRKMRVGANATRSRMLTAFIRAYALQLMVGGEAHTETTRVASRTDIVA